jgi:hypothetical protein
MFRSVSFTPYRSLLTEAEANLNTFTSGATVKVEVTAVNSTGESLPSEPVEQVVP